jgi:VacB/RNase II family 3'-5' exoribonuclease
MNHVEAGSAREWLQEIARRAMVARGLQPDFSAAALEEAAHLQAARPPGEAAVQDLRSLPWCSIDNDDSRDLDQLSVGRDGPGQCITVQVAVADVAALVTRGSALDDHARFNTTSVYTPAKIFPMLPERLSTGLTSLNGDEDRLALVVEMEVDPSGAVMRSSVFPAWVRNRAKLAYDSIARWLEQQGPAPAALTAIAGLEQNLRLQREAARRLNSLRHTRGALSFETVQTRPVFADGVLQRLQVETKNTAKELIEDFMIAANGAVAQFLSAKGHASLRRVVRTPKQWDRIVELATAHDDHLPAEPDAGALEQFLCRARARQPAEFADLSLSVIKLLGAGEYVVQRPGEPSPGHFGLAVKDYAHSTAPNRRFPDLLTQRMLKAAIAACPPPYSPDELEALAKHCTNQEDAAKKVERQLVKSAAALLLQGRIGQRFDGIVTGASLKGTWVRVSRPPAEGKLVSGSAGRKVGDRLPVVLDRLDVERGLIDFRAWEADEGAR